MSCNLSVDKVIDFSVAKDLPETRKVRAIAIMAVMLPATITHYLGIKEENLLIAMENVGIKKDDTLDVLGTLLEKGLVIHKISQDGTSGPFSHRYRVNEEKVRIQFVPPPPAQQA
jgi:hypothetical protein